jgi:hypothetical protein
MIDLNTYKLIHLMGLMLLFFGFGGVLVTSYSEFVLPKKARLLAMISHGLGLFFLLLGGFGMLARLGLARELPSWVYSKLLIWLILGGAIALAKRKSDLAWTLLISFVILASTAAYIGLTKPIH